MSEAKWNLFEMPAIDLSVLCIPAECDNIKLPIECEIASRWDAYLLCDICMHFASVMLHFASLISHNLRCIPAYTHQIPMGFFFNHYQIITGTTCISPPKLFDVGGQNLMWEGQSLAIRSIAMVRSVFSFPFRPCDELPSRSCEASLFRFYGMPLPTG